MKSKEITPGSTFDNRYTIEGFLGRGSTSTVYRATDDMQKGKPVALKLFTNTHISQANIDREVTILSSLHHPSIIQFHRYGETDTLPYIDMELAQGTFRGALRSPNRLSVHDAAKLIVLTTDAVGYAHRQGIIHRDLKPASLLYTGTVKVGDWGFSVQTTDGQPHFLSSRDQREGHPAYMAPEQLRKKPVPASDIYVLGGLVAYEAFTGRQAIRDIAWYDAMARQFISSPPPFEKVLKGGMTEIHAAVEVPIRKALAKDPLQRQASMGEYREELIEAYSKGHEEQAKDRKHL